MQIIGDFYKLTPVTEHSTSYDLELLYSIGGKNPRQEFKIVAYGISLEYAIRKIIQYAIHLKFKEESITLNQFINAYKEESNKIRRELRNTML